MHRSVKAILTGILFIVACVLTGCKAPEPDYYDPKVAAKFGTYKCFTIDSFEDTEVPRELAVSPSDYRKFERAITAVFKQRGYANNCPKADFIVRFHAIKRTVNDIEYYNNTFSNPIFDNNFSVGIEEGGAIVSGFGGGNGGLCPPPGINRYDESIFVIDVIDTQSQELVWYGAYAEPTARKPFYDAEIRTIVNTIMAQLRSTVTQPDVVE